MSVQTWLGLLGLGVVVWACLWWRAPAIEAGIQERVDAALREAAPPSTTTSTESEASEASGSGVEAVVSGRNVRLRGVVASATEEARLLRAVAAVRGVRWVASDVTHGGGPRADAPPPGPQLAAKPQGADLAPIPPGPAPEGGAMALPTSTLRAPTQSPALETPEAKALTVDLEALLERRSIEFEHNHHDLSSRGVETVDEVFDLLERAPSFVVEIGGHTDTTGPEAYNLDLSRRRAQTVAAALIDRGIAIERLVPLGFGSSKPRASNRTERGRARNRRIEFRVIGETEP